MPLFYPAAATSPHLLTQSFFPAGYTWAHNNVSYFSQYHQGREIGYWFMICAIAGGSVGVFVGEPG